MRHYLIACVIVSSSCLMTAFTQTTAKRIPLPCVTSKRGDTHPWDHNAEVLSSYPPEAPRYLGSFRDKAWDYELQLYRDAKGLFGELLSPVLESDSPDSRLYDVVFDPKVGTLRFGARFRDGQLHFTGVLHNGVVRGTITRDSRSENVILRRVRISAEDPYTSRAQFECAMTLFHRY
jgi:hypothetical protein